MRGDMEIVDTNRRACTLDRCPNLTVVLCCVGSVGEHFEPANKIFDY